MAQGKNTENTVAAGMEAFQKEMIFPVGDGTNNRQYG